MQFEKIETAYQLLLENIQHIQNQLHTAIYDAIIEQNSDFVAMTPKTDKIATNNQQLKELNLTSEEWRRAFQFILMKAGQTEPLQFNHQFTPDSIGFLILYLLEQLSFSETLSVLEIGSGTGNLAFTLINHSQKAIDYFGIEIDDLLIDLSASFADILNAPIGLAQGDAVRPQILKKSQFVISDLPIGYYPDDTIAKRYHLASSTEHTYAHHLLMEQSLKYLEDNGYAIFLAPNNLLTSPQSSLLKSWLTNQASLIAMITLPDTLFGNVQRAKSIFILQKQCQNPPQTFVYPLQNLHNLEQMKDFTENFEKWKLDHAI